MALIGAAAGSPTGSATGSATGPAAELAAGTIRGLAAGTASGPAAQHTTGFQASLQIFLDVLAGQSEPGAGEDTAAASPAAPAQPGYSATLPSAAGGHAHLRLRTDGRDTTTLQTGIQTGSQTRIQAGSRSQADSETGLQVHLAADNGHQSFSAAGPARSRKTSTDTTEAPAGSASQPDPASLTAPIAIPASAPNPGAAALAAKTADDAISGPGTRQSSFSHPAQENMPGGRSAEIAAPVPAIHPGTGAAKNSDSDPSPETPVSTPLGSDHREARRATAIPAAAEVPASSVATGSSSGLSGRASLPPSRLPAGHLGQDPRVATQSPGSTPGSTPLTAAADSLAASAAPPGSPHAQALPHNSLAPHAAAPTAVPSLLNAASPAPAGPLPSAAPRQASAIEPATPPSSPADTFTALDAASTPSASWVHADTRHAEAGYLDPSLGWVSVRAESAGGALHASLVPGSAEAAQVLGSHLAGLNSYVAEHHGTGSQVILDPPHAGQSAPGFGQAGSSPGNESGRDAARQPAPGTSNGASGAHTIPATPNPSTGAAAAATTAPLGGHWKHISVVA